MRILSSLLLSVLISLTISSQSLVGAWEAQTTSDEGVAIRNVLILSEAYQVLTLYEANSGKFISTNGGSWAISDDNVITEVVEFDTVDPERVGTEVSFEVYIKNNMMGIVGDKVVWSRIDDGSPGALQGAWLMSGRVRDGETRMRDTNRPRKTMKMLSGTRFQWIAYNIETKQFMGTGGGSYTTVDGTYTENIEFFSRDDTRAGKSLEFDFELIDGKWNHKGFSSKGDAMHEIWEVRVN